MTPILFRADRSGDFKGVVTAVFPTIAADVSGNQMTCYSHIGQHSGCSLGWYHSTRAATPQEYRDLLKELQAIGYDDLRIVKRISRAMREKRSPD
jgi:hypothetical protein